MFDTLAYYEDLRKAGLDGAPAAAIAHGQLNFAEQHLVSRMHFDATTQRLEARIDSLRKDLEAKVDSLRTEVRLHIV